MVLTRRRGGALLLGAIAIAGAVLTEGPARGASAAPGSPRIVINGVAPAAWFPCKSGQVKLDLMRREYLLPSHARYVRPGVDVACADNAGAARAQGFHPAS